MIRFLYPELLWLLVLVPLIALWRSRRGPVQRRPAGGGIS